ncbi:MAG: SixA phosphatase family protein [Pseudomonadota bacterium]
MELVLIRHGEAERDAPRDELRPLTARGTDEARASGQRLATLGLPSPFVVSSPYVRARTTADIIATVLGSGPVRELRGITPDDNPRQAVLNLAQACQPGRTLVAVTHMPLIGSLIALLVDDDLRQARGVRTAGGVVLAGDFPMPGAMRIRTMLD